MPKSNTASDPSAVSLEKATKWAAKMSRRADRRMTAKAHKKAARACAEAAEAHRCVACSEDSANGHAARRLALLGKQHADTCAALGGKQAKGISLAWTDEAREASIAARRASAAAHAQSKVAEKLKAPQQAREAAEAHEHATESHKNAEDILHDVFSKNKRHLKNRELFDMCNEHNLSKLEHVTEAKKWRSRISEYAKENQNKPKDKSILSLGFAFEIPPDELAFADGNAWLMADDGSKLYRKHILKLGHFVKKTDGLRFSIGEREFDHFEKTFAKMQENGVKVPLPLGHTDDDHKNRGWVVGIERNQDDPRYLDAIVECDHPELIKENDVSVFVPPEFTDGEGNTYVRPIRHLALTPYPVIPGLGNFQAISASFESPLELAGADEFDGTGDDRGYAELLAEAEELGKSADDSDTVNDHREAAYAYLRAAEAAESKGDVEGAATCRAEASKHADEAGIALSHDEPEDQLLARLSEKLGKPVTEEDVLKALKCSDEPAAEKKRPSKKSVSIALSEREQRLHRLVVDGYATPAQVSAIASVHCKRHAVALSLSDDPDTSSMSDDAFEAAVKALSVGGKIHGNLLSGERSGPQVKVELSNERTINDSNPLLADAEARASTGKQH
jgi:hypothetical protein